MGTKLGRNDPCWCASGRKYKNCHLGRSEEVPISYGPLLHQLKQQFKVKQCLHPSASSTACGQFIQAHTLQRSKVLAQIKDASNHVRTFYPLALDSSKEPILHCIGWKNASTFPGFCGLHDDQAFAPLEKIDFTGTPEQCFLIAYRALCHEVYQKEAALRSLPTLKDEIDKGLSIEDQHETQHRLKIQKAGLAKGLQYSQLKKLVLDQHFLKQDYSAWSHLVIRFEGDLCVASTGALTPDVDLNGHSLQVLNDPNAIIQHLFHGVVSTHKGGAAVFSWLSNEMAPTQFVDSLNR